MDINFYKNFFANDMLTKISSLQSNSSSTSGSSRNNKDSGNIDTFTKTLPEFPVPDSTAGGSYQDAVTLESGEKTDYFLEYDNVVYYFKSKLELDHAKLLVDPSELAVGIGKIEEQWGEITDYYIEWDGYYYYFSSEFDLAKAKMLTKEGVMKSAIGRQSVENEGPSYITNTNDAVTNIEGEKTPYFIDIDGIRYYFKSLEEVNKASLLNDPTHGACGKARVMTKWGSPTGFYMDFKGTRYYFANEIDRTKALERLKNNDSYLTMYYIENLIVAKETIPKDK